MTTKREKPVVGQALYSLNVGNRARHREQVLTPVKVVKVGRKYFTTEIEGGRFPDPTQFHISDWLEKSDYMAGQRLYATKQEWLDEKESGKITALVRRAFARTSPRLPLDTLRQIQAVLNQLKEQQDER